MSETIVARYVMNPAEDVVLFGDELTDGMWVLPDAPRGGGTEDERLRSERFRRITKLRRYPACGSLPAGVQFIAEWVDGYQESCRFADIWGWIVKKDSLPGAGSPDADGGETE